MSKSKCRIKGELGKDSICGSIVVGEEGFCGYRGNCEHKMEDDRPKLCWQFTMASGGTITTLGCDYEDATETFPKNKLHQVRKVISYEPGKFKHCDRCGKKLY